MTMRRPTNPTIPRRYRSGVLTNQHSSISAHNLTDSPDYLSSPPRSESFQCTPKRCMLSQSISLQLGAIRPSKGPSKGRPSVSSEVSYHSASEYSYSSTSESDLESTDERSRHHDESSLTDDLGVTPTATPKATSPTQPKHHHRLSDHHQPPIPVGAVELKPYKHQVGGHTTVFCFSRRAVCKSLSNRENEFYEIVELEHQELLPFLPKYVHFLLHIFEISAS